MQHGHIVYIFINISCLPTRPQAYVMQHVHDPLADTTFMTN